MIHLSGSTVLATRSRCVRQKEMKVCRGSRFEFSGRTAVVRRPLLLPSGNFRLKAVLVLHAAWIYESNARAFRASNRVLYGRTHSDKKSLFDDGPMEARKRFLIQNHQYGAHGTSRFTELDLRLGEVESS